MSTKSKKKTPAKPRLADKPSEVKESIPIPEDTVKALHSLIAQFQQQAKLLQDEMTKQTSLLIVGTRNALTIPEDWVINEDATAFVPPKSE